MPSTTPAAREARARRLADSFGLRLHRSRRGADRGFYALTDIDTGGAAYGIGVTGYDADLEDIEAYLAE